MRIGFHLGWELCRAMRSTWAGSEPLSRMRGPTCHIGTTIHFGRLGAPGGREIATSFLLIPFTYSLPSPEKSQVQQLDQVFLLGRTDFKAFFEWPSTLPFLLGVVDQLLPGRQSKVGTDSFRCLMSTVSLGAQKKRAW